MDCSLPGSSVHGILQVRIREWVAMLFSMGSSPPRDGTQVSCIAGGFFTIWAIWEALGWGQSHSQNTGLSKNRMEVAFQTISLGHTAMMYGYRQYLI